DLLQGSVARRRVIGVEAGLSQRLHGLEPFHSTVERLHEEEPPHLAVAHDVDARTLLVADGELGGVVERLLHVGGAVLAGLDLVEGGPEPAGKAVAPHDVRGNQWEGRWHGGSLPEFRTDLRRLGGAGPDGWRRARPSR